MPITYEIQPNLIRYLTEGDVEYADGLRTLQEGLRRAREIAESDTSGKFHVLFDVRRSTENRSGDELKRIAEVLGEHTSFLSGRAAVVAADAFHVGLARIFGAYADGQQIEVRVFEALEEAESWLQESGPAS